MEYNDEFQGMQRESFIFYASFQEAMEDLTEHEQFVLYRAIAKYALYGELPQFGKEERMPSMCWKLICPQLDANWRRFINGSKGKDYGKQGGNPNFRKGQPNPYYPKDTPTDNGTNNPKDNPKGKTRQTSETEDKPKGCSKFDFSFVEDDYREAFYKWLEYKYDIDGRKFYKSQTSIEIAYKELLRLSGNDAQQALQIVERSIANSWNGMFELKTQQQNGNSRQYSRTPAENIAAAQNEQFRNIAATLVGEAENGY